MTADEEPHFIEKPVEDKGPDIPEADEAALEEIEEKIDDGEVCNDIGSAMKSNMGKVIGAIKDFVNGKNKKKKADCPADADVKPINMVHFAANIIPTCSIVKEE